MITPMNFDWSFAPGRQSPAIESPMKNAEKVNLPHCVSLFPAQYLNERDYQKEYTYQIQFDAPGHFPVHKLVFHGVMLQFDAYLNGKSLGHFISGYLPVTIDISDLLQPKHNLLTLFVDGHEDPSIPPFGKVVDYLTFAGIYREVELLSLPAAHILDARIEAHMDGRVNVELKTVGEAGPIYRLLDEGKEVVRSEESSFILHKPHLWSLSDPHLYTLEIAYGEDQRHYRIGFRDIAWTREGLYLNDVRVPIIGLNRHQTYPYFGPAAPKSLQEEDADLLKASGINLVRTSHYPQSEHFLSRCDEIGLLFVDEIPGWQYIGEDEEWRNNCRDFARRMIQKERNHPSLVAYGLRIDESNDDDELYASIQKIRREEDPTRLSLGVRNFKDSHCLEDIYAYNDFSCNSLDHGADPAKSIKGAEGRPVLISESNGHMFPTKSFDPVEKRAEHALRHAKVLEDVLADHSYCGAITWCAFDYYTHKDFGAGDHVCHHGVYDMFRNPKYAAEFFASQGDDKPVLALASSMQPAEYNEALMPKIYCFTNGDCIKLYHNDAYIGTFFPDRKNYPHLPHPPICIDDIIGETFDEPKISKEDGRKIVAAFNYCAQNGFGRLRLKDKILLARLMAKYKLDYTYVYQTYAKYIQSWGEGSSIWRLEAYKKKQRIASITRGPSTDFHLALSTTRDYLIHGKTYDCLSLHVYKKDQLGNTMPYASDPLEIAVSGPVEVYGPSLVSLYGGATTVYLRSKPVKNPTEAIVTLTCNGDSIEYRLIVRPEQ